jgi:2-polyprenyl-3-methyl-5-hydroxy-6-metoxy-1,4-benzoquinol methylase
MSVITEAWVFLNRIRRIGKPPIEDWVARRHRFVAEFAPGRSFADIGGLFQLHGDIALRAHRAGATMVTLFDSGDESYGGFAEKRREAGPTVRFVQGDLEEGISVERIGCHDVVWCTGVIYHTPNPVVQLMHLRAITGELLYLGTHTVPEIPGFQQACIYYPYLPEKERRAHARAYPDAEQILGIGAAFDERAMHGYGNFWWGITPSALRAMLESARFEVIEEIRSRAFPWLIDVICRPIDQKPLLPPRSYFRQRAERRERGEAELPWLSAPSTERGWWG